MEPQFDVLGVGNAIVDVIAAVPESFITEHGLVKGAMTLIDADRARSLYAAMPPGIEASGGSAANTAAGVASFDGRAAYIGKVRDDQLGEVFIHDIRAAGVTFGVAPAKTGPPTARCLIQVTPDAERTMNTFPGLVGPAGTGRHRRRPGGLGPSHLLRGLPLGRGRGQGRHPHRHGRRRGRPSDGGLGAQRLALRGPSPRRVAGPDRRPG